MALRDDVLAYPPATHTERIAPATAALVHEMNCGEANQRELAKINQALGPVAALPRRSRAPR